MGIPLLISVQGAPLFQLAVWPGFIIQPSGSQEEVQCDTSSHHPSLLFTTITSRGPGLGLGLTQYPTEQMAIISED